MITKEQFEEWKEHPVTKEIFINLKEIKKDIQEQMGYGNTIGSDAESTHGLTSKAVGQLLGIDQILNITFEDGSEDDTNGKSRY